MMNYDLSIPEMKKVISVCDVQRMSPDQLGVTKSAGTERIECCNNATKVPIIILSDTVPEFRESTSKVPRQCQNSAVRVPVKCLLSASREPSQSQ